MLKFTIKIQDKKDDNSCNVILVSPKKEEFEKATSGEKSIACVLQNSLAKMFDELQNQKGNEE